MSNHRGSFPNVNTHTSCHNSSAETMAGLSCTAESERTSERAIHCVPTGDVNSFTSVEHI